MIGLGTSLLRQIIHLCHTVQEAPVEPEPKFNPFSGVGRRLDGKPQNYQPPPVSTSMSKEKQPVSAGSGQPSTGSSSQSTSRQSQGKLVFGSNVNRTPKGTQKVLFCHQPLKIESS